MLHRYTPIKVPESLTRMCSVVVKDRKRSYLEICQILESDTFLSLYIGGLFEKEMGKGGALTLLNSRGWEGVRDNITEAYLFHSVEKRFPTEIEPDYVLDVIDFLKRFEFIYTHGNMRVFTLGIILKLLNLELEDEGNSLLIPVEVDEILATKVQKSHHPDWLIVAVWGLVEILGATETKELLERSKGKWNRIENELNELQLNEYLSHMLAYGHAIGDTSFFTLEKV